eukprot:COSAG06_NODE_63393_length_262_cov_0.907975_1_plen_73_part_10
MVLSVSLTHLRQHRRGEELLLVRPTLARFVRKLRVVRVWHRVVGGEQRRLRAAPLEIPCKKTHLSFSPLFLCL